MFLGLASMRRAIYTWQGSGSTWPSMTTFLSPTPGEASFYVMKISGPSTSTPQVAYVAAIGPSGPDGGGPVAMAVDPAGNVYLAGYTGASDFPTTPGSFQTFSATGGGFLLKLDPTGKKLVYSTLFAFPVTTIYALVVDASGNAYIGGTNQHQHFPHHAGSVSESRRPNLPRIDLRSIRQRVRPHRCEAALLYPYRRPFPRFPLLLSARSLSMTLEPFISSAYLEP